MSIVTINPSNVTLYNALMLGTQDTHGNWRVFSPIYKMNNGSTVSNPDAAKAVDLYTGFKGKLVRLHEFQRSSIDPLIAPCSQWNETTKTGTWNWTNMDYFVDDVFGMGAEPIISVAWAVYPSTFPPGMTIDATTQLPHPDDWAAYCSEYPKHFLQTGMPVRYYEVTNEPWMYWEWANYTKLGYYKNIINPAFAAMRAVNPNVQLGFDGVDRKFALNWWLANGGADLDFLSFHKYDSGSLGSPDDATLLNRAETNLLDSTTDYYGVQDLRQAYYNSRGKLLPVFNSESNLNSYTDTTTDSRIQQIIGGVWLALTLRKSILVGLNGMIYFNMFGDYAWHVATKPPGWGLGMVNHDDYKPWFPYWVYKMVGGNIDVGDSVVESSVNNSNLRVLSWNNNGKLNILLIHKSTNTNVQVSLSGVSGTFQYTSIDGSLDVHAPIPKQGTTTGSLTFNGYTVTLLQQPAVSTKKTYRFQQWSDDPSQPNPRQVTV